MSVLEKGATIAGRYRLERPLARGGMGAVWVATHLGLDAPVAIKFLDAALASSPEMLTRFEREGRAAARLRGAHVVQILDHGVDDEMPFIVMELLDGEDLSTRLKREGRLPPRSVIRIVTEVTAALAKAHELGIVHRDLKPANVFLARDQSGEVTKVLDFGIAKVLAADDGDVTKTGDVVGSPLYMSPEQVRGAKHVDHRTDLWALGVIAYKALTGVGPFGGDSSGAILVSVATEPALAPSAHVTDLPPGADAFFERALAKDREKRFQTARELGEALAAVFAEPAPRAAPLPASPSPAGTQVTAGQPEQAARPRVNPLLRTIPLTPGQAPSPFAPQPGGRETGRAPVLPAREPAPAVIAPSAPQPAPAAFAPIVPQPAHAAVAATAAPIAPPCAPVPVAPPRGYAPVVVAGVVVVLAAAALAVFALSRAQPALEPTTATVAAASGSAPAPQSPPPAASDEPVAPIAGTARTEPSETPSPSASARANAPPSAGGGAAGPRSKPTSRAKAPAAQPSVDYDRR
jgi:serine/threonine-protein kinase